MSAWLRLLAWVRPQLRGDNSDYAITAGEVRRVWDALVRRQSSSEFDYATSAYVPLAYGERARRAAQHLGTCDGCSRPVVTGYTQLHPISQSLLACTHCDRCLRGCCECPVCESCDRRCGDGQCADCDRCHDCCECASCETCGTQRTRESRRWCSGCLGADDPGYRCTGCCDGSCRPAESSDSVEFFTQKPTFHDASRLQRKFNTSGRYIAAEIEVAEVDDDDGISRTVRRWGGSIVEDGSLASTGFEINTAPARGDVFVREIREICGALKASGASVDRKCGLHVHVDAKDLNHYELQRVIRLYAAVEPLLFQLVPASRRNNRFCEPCGNGYMRTMADTAKWAAHKGYKLARTATAQSVYGESNTRSRKTNKYDHARYAALNLHSWFYRGTLECRMFGGTTDPDKIIAWGMLWARLIDVACKLSDVDAQAVYTWTHESPGATCDRHDWGRQYSALMQHVVGDSGYLRDFVRRRLELCAEDSVRKELGHVYAAVGDAGEE